MPSARPVNMTSVDQAAKNPLLPRVREQRPAHESGPAPGRGVDLDRSCGLELFNRPAGADQGWPEQWPRSAVRRRFCQLLVWSFSCVSRSRRRGLRLCRISCLRAVGHRAEPQVLSLLLSAGAAALDVAAGGHSLCAGAVHLACARPGTRSIARSSSPATRVYCCCRSRPRHCSSTRSAGKRRDHRSLARRRVDAGRPPAGRSPGSCSA